MFDLKKMTEHLVFVAYLTLYIYLYYKLSLSDFRLPPRHVNNAIMMITMIFKTFHGTIKCKIMNNFRVHVRVPVAIFTTR